MSPQSAPSHIEAEKIPRINPWFGIWNKTAATLQYVWRHQPEEWVHRLYMAAGVIFVLAGRLPDWLSVPPNLIGVMIQVLMAGPIGGIVIGYMYAAILRAVGRWFGGLAPSKLAKVTVSWTQWPFIVFWVLVALLYVVFNLSQHDPNPNTHVIWAFSGMIGWLPLLIPFPIYLWGIWIRVKGIAALLEINYARAFGVWAITTFLTYVPTTTLATIYFMVFYITSTKTD